MLKILLFAIIVTLIIITSAQYKKLSPLQQRKLAWRVGTGILLGVLVLLVITGRLHWIGAVIGALIPFVRSAVGLVGQLLPVWLHHKKKSQEQEDAQDQPISQTNMDLKEAMQVLGLTGDIKKGELTEDMIQHAHKRLIQKLHPDRGGNDYLAAKINQARDLLLKEIG